MNWYLIWALRVFLWLFALACFVSVSSLPLVSSYLATEGPDWIERERLDSGLVFLGMTLGIFGFVAFAAGCEVKPK